MNPDIWVGIVVGAALGALIMGVFMGSVAHQNYEKYLLVKAQAFGLEEMLLDAYEGNDERHWKMTSKGVDVIVERGRPDDTRRHKEVAEAEDEDERNDPHASKRVLDLTGVEDTPEWATDG
jgi:hypothetical protein